MARLLEPADFGLVAMAGVALRLFGYLSQLGMGAAVIQHPSLSQDQIRRALGWTVLLCLLTTGLAASAADVVAVFFGAPTLSPVVRVLAVNLLLQGLAIIPLALLRRRLQFKSLAVVELGSYAAYVAVAVAVAWMGGGVWSLVAAILVQSLLQLLLTTWLAQLPLVPTLGGGVRELWGYGLRHSLGGFVEFLTANVDAAVIGRGLGESAMGIYGRSTLLVFLPLEKMSSVVAKVVFPLLSQVQQHRSQIGSALLLGISFIGIGSSVFCFTVAAVAPELVLVLLGPGWHEAAGVISVLALGGTPTFMTVLAGVVCDALALLRDKLRLQLMGLVLLAVCCMLFYRHGLIGIAWAVVVTQAVVHLVYMAYLAPLLGCRRGDVARVYGSVILTAVTAYLSTSGLLLPLRAWSMPSLLCLGVASLGALFALSLGLHVWFKLMRDTSPELLAASRIPKWCIWRGRLLGERWR